MRAPVVLAVILSLNAQAQPTLSAFGFEFGKPVTVPECVRMGDGSRRVYEVVQPKTCLKERDGSPSIDRPRTIFFGRDDQSMLLKYGEIILWESDGLLVGVEFFTPGLSAQGMVLEQLTAKYGPPTKLTDAEYKNAAGAALTGKLATWELPGLRVTFEGMTRRVDQGWVRIETPVAAAMRDAEIKRRMESERKL